MAFEEYVPKTTVFHPTVSMPDDAQMRINGIGAFNTPLQQLADNVSAVNTKIPPWIGEHRPEWYMGVGTDGDLLFSFASNQGSTIEYPIVVKENGVDRYASFYFPDCKNGDLIQFAASMFMLIIDNSAFIRLRGIWQDTNEVMDISKITYGDDQYTRQRFVSGGYQCKRGGLFGAQISIGKVGPGEVKIFNEFRFMATRWRAV